MPMKDRQYLYLMPEGPAPSLSDLTRKRRVRCNPPPKGERRACGDGSNEPKNVTATQGVKEFSEECLEVTGAGKS